MGSSLSEEELWTALDAVIENVQRTVDRIGNEFAYYADETGTWETTDDGDWCGGHWIGLLWLASVYTDSERERERLQEVARVLTDRLNRTLPTNTMFYGLNHQYAGFRAYDISGDRTAFGLGLDGADAMVEYYHEGARQIPLGEFQLRGPTEFRGPNSDHGPVGSRIGAVDNVYTALPILWRAYEETKRPIFRDTALSHADRHLDWYIRPDGSTWHHAVFDLETGDLETQYNELAASDQTCWARGQGWNIAGLARTYTETGAERFLAALERTVRYYEMYSPKDLIPHWDFRVTDADEPRDTSAAALAAYGLLRLPDDSKRVHALRRTGAEILRSLVDSYLVTDPKNDSYGLVLHGCFNRPGNYVVDNPLVWTQYYLAYTLHYLLSER